MKTKSKTETIKTFFDYRSFLKTVSTKSGVYQMLDADKKIIYVGKAKNLKNRLSSYFRFSNAGTKTQLLVASISDIEIIITPSENDALILENNLIKQYKPKFNVRLVDDKSYSYIQIQISKHRCPKFGLYRGSRQQQKGELFGPFPSALAVQETLELIVKIFKLRQCEDSFFSNRSRPCVQFQIKRCSGPCTHEISEHDYLLDVKQAIQFLNGNSKSVINELTRSMHQYSSDLLFEKAAKLRDQINQINQIINTKLVTNSVEGNIQDVDIFALHLESCTSIAAVTVLNVRDGRLLGCKNYFPVISKFEEKDNILCPFISQYYNHDRTPPFEIIIGNKLANTEEHISEILMLTEYLNYLSYHMNVSTRTKARKVKINCFSHNEIVNHVSGSSKISERIKMLKIAQDNAVTCVNTKIASQSNIKNRLQDLASYLDIPNIKYIECFDISHTFGEKTVASNVVFTETGFVKNEYRLFNIEGITKGDDCAAMENALTKRFTSENFDEKHNRNPDIPDIPDILLIDGGIQQLNVAINVIKKLNIESKMILIGVAKGEGRKSGLETLWIEDFARNRKQKTLTIKNNSPAFHLILQIRDESHRFAIQGHRKQRDKLRKQSFLNQIHGIGEKKKNALLENLGGISGVKKASIEDLMLVKGISKNLATLIFETFLKHSIENKPRKQHEHEYY